MKILLARHHDIGNINTRLPESINKAQGIYPPLGLLYIAAVLEQNGHEVKVLDSQALNLTTQETKEEIKEFTPDIVGATAMTPNLLGALEVLRLAKEVSSETGKDIKTVIGGVHMSVYPQETITYDFIDYGVIGEGEYAMLELAEAIENNKDVSNIEGIVYKDKKGKIKTTGARIVDDIDSLPFPARHLIQMDKYHCVITGHPFTTMMTSRGCPFRCGFCFKTPSDRKMRYRNPKNVVDEMEYAVKTYKVKEIMFYDDTFTDNRKHVVDVCNEIIRRGLKVKWECPTRVDCLDEELLRLMKKAGCIRLRLGVESGNQKILDIMRKRTTLEKIERAFRLTKMVGIETFAYFMVGYVYENEQTIRDTINFAKKLDADWTMFTVATPLPDTNLWELAVKEKLVEPDYWLNFTTGKSNERMPFLVKDADKWAKKAYKEFYMRPSFVLKKLAKMRSIDTMRKYYRGFNSIVSFEMRGD